MPSSQASRLVNGLILTALSVCAVGHVSAARAVDVNEVGKAIYSPDPRHLWNRLHEAIFVRVGPDGTRYGRDRLDPLLWVQSKHLLKGASCERTIELLNEFIQAKGDKLVGDPLKRALLQRDLWMV